MNAFRVSLLMCGVLLSGCINIKAPQNLYINSGNGDNGDNGGKDDAAAPSQLPASGGSSLRDIATDLAGRLFLGAEKGAIFYAYDTLAYPGSPVDLVAQLQTTRDMKAVRGATVGFFKGDEQIGTAETDDKGRASLQWTPPDVGDHAFSARVLGAPEGVSKDMLALSADLLVAARAKDTRFVVIDLDHTVVDSGFFRVLVGGAKPMPHSVEVTKRIATVYSIIYLTHRPDLLTTKSKTWLSRQGYPRAPLLVSQLKDAFGDSGKFKTAKLKEIRRAFGKVTIGIGDKLSDAQAYVDNGLTAYLIPHYKEKPKDMRKMADQVAKMKGKGRLNVVDGWREIEAGIFRNRKFPPKTYASRLRRRAGELEAEKSRRRKRDDDDDDDDDD